jgi:hypothetical protein
VQRFHAFEYSGGSGGNAWLVSFLQERVDLGASKGAPTFFDLEMPQRHKKTRRERVTKLLADIEGALDVKTLKVTLADFIRLTQLERELEQEEQPREIIVTWKEPAEEYSDSK